MRLAGDPALITRFPDDLTVAGLTTASRVQVLKVFRSVLRWGRRRYPRTLTVEFSGLFSFPSQQRKRLTYAADAWRSSLARRVWHLLQPPTTATGSLAPSTS